MLVEIIAELLASFECWIIRILLLYAEKTTNRCHRGAFLHVSYISITSYSLFQDVHYLTDLLDLSWSAIVRFAVAFSCLTLCLQNSQAHKDMRLHVLSRLSCIFPAMRAPTSSMLGIPLHTLSSICTRPSHSPLPRRQPKA